MVLQTNFIAVLIAAILSMVLGYVWYHDQVFGKLWKEAHGCKDHSKESPLQLFGGFINTLVIAWVFGALLNFFGVASVIGAVTTGFWFWLGFIATTQFSGVIWAKKPLKSYFIDSGFFLGMIVVMAIVFGVLT